LEKDERARVLELLRAYGWNTTSFQILERGFAYWFDAAGNSCVAYVDTGTAWVAAGAPIAPAETIEAVAEQFVAEAARKRRRVCFFAVERRLVGAPWLRKMPIGEQPVWDPSSWGEIVQREPRLREQIRRAGAKGVVVRSVAAEEIERAPLRAEFEELIANWLTTRKMAPMGFLVDVQPFDFAKERRCFVAEQRGRVVGILVAVPVYQRSGWLFEDLLRSPEAPNGTNEMLIDLAMRSVAEEGSRYVTLGLAPLAGRVSRRLSTIRALSATLYDFDGVRRFKSKLRPEHWSTIYLAWPRQGSSFMALYDSLAAFTMRSRDGHERASFVRFGLETIAHAPAAGVRLLAILLVPWTALLASPVAARFFSSRAVQFAWVIFDIGLTVAMLSLAARWRSTLARSLALLTAMDAFLTLVEVVADARMRVHSAFDAFIVAVACTGPLLAATLLWHAQRVRIGSGARKAH